ncbi:MAG TPA: hypothetical protein VMZ29_12065 [Candidatus Bathyarchaeia archaeon]|nr:hypothetical protein [Candidatus Bathyarchaeia archaeon]
MNQTEVIKLAEKHAAELGYDIPSMKVIVEKYNKPWNRWLRKTSTDEYCVERKNLLKGKTYWAVYFSHNEEVDGRRYRGGDICVFIDVTTSEIITNVRGK